MPRTRLSQNTHNPDSCSRGGHGRYKGYCGVNYEKSPNNRRHHPPPPEQQRTHYVWTAEQSARRTGHREALWLFCENLSIAGGCWLPTPVRYCKETPLMYSRTEHSESLGSRNVSWVAACYMWYSQQHLLTRRKGISNLRYPLISIENYLSWAIPCRVHPYVHRTFYLLWRRRGFCVFQGGGRGGPEGGRSGTAPLLIGGISRIG